MRIDACCSADEVITNMAVIFFGVCESFFILICGDATNDAMKIFAAKSITLLLHQFLQI
jgi:hypothetical protein